MNKKLNNRKSLEDRILRLEKIQYQSHIPGTQLVRTLDKEKGFLWSLALGPMILPKAFYYGKTIKETIEEAEKSWGIKK